MKRIPLTKDEAFICLSVLCNEIAVGAIMGDEKGMKEWLANMPAVNTTGTAAWELVIPDNGWDIKGLIEGADFADAETASLRSKL